MASISDDLNGRRRILFIDPNKRRHTIRLGKVSRRYAESVKVKIEDLVSASITGHPPRDETARWLKDLDDALYQKVAKVGLARPRGSATLKAFLDAYIGQRKDVKPTTTTV